MGALFARRGDEIGASECAWGDHGYDRHGFLTILDNVLTAGESAEDEEEGDQPHPQTS